MAVERKPMTAEELWAMPNDGMRHELVEGELRTMPPTGWEHGRYEVGISYRLSRWLDDNPIGELGGGEVGCRLGRDPDTVRAADVAFVRAERLPGGRLTGYFEGAPDLAVEIVSPGDTASEVEEKVRTWLAAGVGAVWVVYPSAPSLTVFRPDGSARHHGPDDDLDGGDVLPGFRMRLADLLRRPGQPRS
ncbi:MAG TPA: Uma2 family endonuclease [Chloroflexota bacterium]|jgi:Uma2 family endonuclease